MSSSQLHAKLLELCRYASLAPSVHNTQPWRFKVSSSSIEIHIDPASILQGGDPTHRELWLSIGACLENLTLATGGLGLKTDSLKTDTYEDFPNRPVAVLQFKEANGPRDDHWLKLIEQRVTDRSSYQKLPISKEWQAKIKTAYISKSVRIEVSDNPELLRLAGDLTTRAMSVAMGMPAFRAELRELVKFNWDKSGVGMPGYTLNRNALGSILEKAGLATSLGASHKAVEDGKLVAAGPALILVFASGDTPPYWLEAGRAYERASLEATALGLHTATLAAAVEAGDFHEDIEHLIGTNWRLQALVRIGYPVRKRAPHSPRLPLEKIIIT